MVELKVGTLCYYNSITALVPGKVKRIYKNSEGLPKTMVDILVTANRGPYVKGEVITTTAINAIPRKAVRGSKIMNYGVVVG